MVFAFYFFYLIFTLLVFSGCLIFYFVVCVFASYLCLAALDCEIEIYISERLKAIVMHCASFLTVALESLDISINSAVCGGPN